jgi:hypothetical protein
VSLPTNRPERVQLVRDIILVTLAIVSVLIAIYQLSAEPTGRMGLLDWIDLGIVAIFWIDFIAESRRVGIRPYVRTHWWELPSLIPAVPALVALFPAVAFVRALRLLRLARIVSVVLRLRPAGAYVVQIARAARVDIILAVGAGVVLLGAALTYLLERASAGPLADLGEATWFAFNMFTNVAFVDAHPTTLGARALAGILQLCGIAFIGIFTASLAGAIIREPAVEEES